MFTHLRTGTIRQYGANTPCRTYCTVLHRPSCTCTCTGHLVLHSECEPCSYSSHRPLTRSRTCISRARHPATEIHGIRHSVQYSIVQYGAGVPTRHTVRTHGQVQYSYCVRRTTASRCSHKELPKVLAVLADLGKNPVNGSILHICHGFLSTRTD